MTPLRRAAFLFCSLLCACSVEPMPGSEDGHSQQPGSASADGGSASADGGASTADGGNGSLADGPHLFGLHTFAYPNDTLRPSGSAASLDAATTAFYAKWKSAYVKQGCGGYYVLSGGGTGEDVGDEISEGHGYGMVIAALMAGHDPDAKKIFDGMYAFFRRFPSASSPDLMGWTVDVAGGCKFPTGSSDSATDGDLDIANALLLADRQWGSSGAINYLAEAKKVINAVMTHEVRASTHLPLLGDWAEENDFSTRPSDFMTGHFHSFAKVTGVNAWNQVADAVYALETQLQTSRSTLTGLMPDFVINTNTASPTPAQPNFLEGPHDGEYDYNACRNPWRIASDYLLHRDARAKSLLQKTNAWIASTTGGVPSKIVDGYTLAGAKTGSGPDLAFVAPFAVAAMVGANQAWLDALWTELVNRAPEGYYGDSIKMLAMLVLSGNTFAP